MDESDIIAGLIKGGYYIGKEEISKKMDLLKMFKRKGKNKEAENEFKIFFTNVKSQIEEDLWLAKSKAVSKEGFNDVSAKLNECFSKMLGIFRTIQNKFDPSKISEDLYTDLKDELNELLIKSSNTVNAINTNNDKKACSEEVEKIIRALYALQTHIMKHA